MSVLGTGSIDRTQVKRLAILGFDGPSMASLELFLGRERELLIVGPEQADFLIVNGDQAKSPEELEAFYAKRYAKPGILISVREMHWDTFVFLQKPYESAQLVAAIKALSLPAGNEGGLNVGGSTVAAVMDLQQDGPDERTQAYDQYKSRVDAGQSVFESLNNDRQLEAQKKEQLKEKLRRGRDASKRAAQEAMRRIDEERTARVEAEAVPVEEPKAQNTVKSAAEAEVQAVLAEAQAAQQAAKRKAQLKVLAEKKAAEEAAAKAAAKAAEQAARQKKEEAERKEAERKAAERKEAEKKAQLKKLAEKKALEKKLALEKAREQKLAAEREKEKKLAEEKAKAVAKKRAALKKAKLEEAKAAEKAAQAKKAENQADKKAGLTILPEASETKAKKSVAQPAVKTVKTQPVAKSGYADDEMVYRCCGNLADVDITRPDERRRIYFNTDGALLDWLPMAVKKAKLSNTPVEIAGLPRLFVYLPKEDEFFGDFGEDLLLQYALSRFGFGELDLRERPDLAVAKPPVTKDKHTCDDRDAMIWKVALWTARGRLNQGMDPDKIYKLKARPDFSRLIEIPHANEITELWHDHRLSALDVVRILNLPQRYVFAYMSGVYALGWLQE